MIFSPLTVGHVGELVRADVELLRQDGAVARRLVEHDDEVAVLEDVLHLPAGEQVLHILGDAGRNNNLGILKK